VSFTIPGTATPGLAVPGVMDPGTPAAVTHPPPAGPAVVFQLGIPYFQWAAGSPYLS
jgi:hypothetical protein